MAQKLHHIKISFHRDYLIYDPLLSIQIHKSSYIFMFFLMLTLIQLYVRKNQFPIEVIHSFKLYLVFTKLMFNDEILGLFTHFLLDEIYELQLTLKFVSPMLLELTVLFFFQLFQDQTLRVILQQRNLHNCLDT